MLQNSNFLQMFLVHQELPTGDYLCKVIGVSGLLTMRKFSCLHLSHSASDWPPLSGVASILQTSACPILTHMAQFCSRYLACA